jgi:hypothetical protein
MVVFAFIRSLQVEISEDYAEVWAAVVQSV